MIKHLYHEEIGGGYGMRHKTIIDAAEIEPGKFETMAFVEATGEELESVASDNAQDAARDFRAMVQRHAGPLQAAFYRAAMTPGERYTLVFLGEFGFPIALRMTFHDAKLDTYAQYDDAVNLTFTPYKKRQGRRMYLYNRSFLIYAGWRELDASATYNKSGGDGVTALVSKYCSFDEKYIEDIKAMWPDYIVAYDHDRVHYHDDDKPVDAEADSDEDRQPFALLPGMTVLFDVDGADGPCVDIDIEEFAQLFAPLDDDGMETGERLARALKRAAFASVSHIGEHDGGTCNFDSPALDFAACGMSKEDAEGVVKGVGLHCYDWQPFKNHRGDDGKVIKAPTYLVISGFQSGQGNRHTHMAEAFCASMNRDGFETMMYYQMD